MAFTTIDNPELFFQTVLYTGNGGTNAITFDGSENMQPDWIWGRDRAGDRHFLADSVRGKKNTGYYLLSSNNNESDANNAPPDGITAIGTDGFTLGANSSNTDGGWSIEINQNTNLHVAWCWKAGTSFSNDASATSVGSVDSTGSINTTAGFSIISFTSLASGSNYTIAHGLSAKPALILLKGRHEANNWMVYHHKNTSAPETDYLMLDDTAATGDYPVWNDTAPTSSVFSCGTWSGFDDGGTMIAYCFAEKQGYSKFGQYEGNNNADGEYVYLGFRPSIVITKAIDTTSNWLIFDNKRSTFNDVDDYIKGNQTAAEDTGSSDVQMDFLANGFKLRGNNDVVNGAETYVYLAFAESPFVNSKGVPNNAR